MPVTPEQQQALDDLMRAVRKVQNPAPLPAPLPASPAPPPAQTPASQDWMQTWLGVSRQDVLGTVQSLLAQKDGLEARMLDWVESNPLDASLEFLGVAALLFYQAEKGVNPRIQSYVDSFYYISTCASVGYADIFAVTQTGRVIAALVMIVGPALAARSLDRGHSTGLNSVNSG